MKEYIYILSSTLNYYEDYQQEIEEMVLNVSTDLEGLLSNIDVENKEYIDKSLLICCNSDGITYKSKVSLVSLINCDYYKIFIDSNFDVVDADYVIQVLHNFSTRIEIFEAKRKEETKIKRQQEQEERDRIEYERLSKKFKGEN